MSYVQKFVLGVNIIFILLPAALRLKVSGDKIEQSIYKKITGNHACVTLLNATHQIGCKSKRKGNVGVVHYIESDESFDWILNKGIHAPYIPIFTTEHFTDKRLKQFIDAGKISGALVLFNSSHKRNGMKPPGSGFSPEYQCPQENFGLYGSDPKYSCKNGSYSVTWNRDGSGMLYNDYDVPVFAIYKEDEIKDLINCYKDHNKPDVNGSGPDYPLCGVELQSFMFAAKDTPTCIRKTNAPTFTQTGFCEELGDRNVWATLFELNEELINKDDIILVTAKLDGTAFFHDLAFGADNDLTGVIVLLAAANALGKLKRNNDAKAPDLKKNQKHIMFSFFQGEVWDYIGSSRMVYDMQNDQFPCNEKEDSCKFPTLRLSNIAYYLELNQVGLLDEASIWAHRDPASKGDALKKTKTLFNTLSKFGASANLTIQDPSETKLQPLPPASFQRFLKVDRSIPGIVLTDHKASYTNKYYNSRFDDIVNIDAENIDSSGVKQLTSLATTVARTLYELAYNETKKDINASELVVENLVHCFLLPTNCSYFDLKEKDHIPGYLTSRYVGVFKKKNNQVSHASVMAKHVMTFFTGRYYPADKTGCPTANTHFSIIKVNNVTCANASVYYSIAQSPAFLLEDYDSTEYSTWTESGWAREIGIRMFLIADPEQEAITLAVGIILTVLSVVVTIFMYKKADQLFSPDDRVLVISDAIQ